MPKKLKQKFFKAAEGSITINDNKNISINNKNIFIGGNVEGPTAVDFNNKIKTISSNESQQLLIAGLNHCGKQIFYKTAGSQSNNFSSGTNSVSANNKRVFLTGFISQQSSDFENEPLNNAGQDIFVAGLNNCGVQKFFKIAGNNGSSSDTEEGINIVSNGDAAFLVGRINSGNNPRDFNNIPVTTYGDEDIFIASVDNCGIQKFFKTAGSTNIDRGINIGLNKKRFFVTGFINSPTATDFSGQTVNTIGNLDIFIAGLDHKGNQKFFKVSGTLSDDFGLHTIANDKRVFVSGTLESNVILDFEGNNVQNSLSLTNNIFIAALNNCGQQKFYKVAGSELNDSVNDITNDDKGIYLTGTLGGTSAIGFDEQPISNINNTNDVFVAGLDLCGNQKFFKTAGGAGIDSGNSIVSNGSHLFVTGFLNNSGTATDFKGNVVPLKGNSTEIFVAVLDNKNGCQKAFLTAGGTGIDNGVGLAIRDDMIFVTGNLDGECDFNGKTIEKPDEDTIFVARLDDLMPKKKIFRSKIPYF